MLSSLVGRDQELVRRRRRQFDLSDFDPVRLGNDDLTRVHRWKLVVGWVER